MKIGIIGAGNIGGNLAIQFSKAGHEVIISFSRNEQKMKQRAMTLGGNIKADSVAEAVQNSDVVVLSCMWADIDTALAQAGTMTGKIVLDATNQYTADGLVPLPTSVAEYNQNRMLGAKLVRTFNTLTADFQREVGDGKHLPTAMFYATEDTSVKAIAEELIGDTGFTPIFIGGWNLVKLIEAPEGVVLGKSYTPEDAQKIADAAQDGDLERVQQLANTLAR